MHPQDVSRPVAPDGADDWDDHWQRYEFAASHNPAQAMRHQAIIEALRKAGPHFDRLIDVGSGQGDFLAKASTAKIADRYAGFEMSESGVRISRSKLPAIDFVQADLFEPPAAAAPFVGWASVAVCSDVIEHVDDPVAFLSALAMYLAPHGTLVLTVPGGPMSTFDKHIGHRRHYTNQLVRSVLSAAGFHVEEVRLAGFPFFNLYRLMVILRGAKLVDDAQAGDDHGARKRLAAVAMKVFDFLFRFNLPTAPLGWQVIAIARKA